MFQTGVNCRTASKHLKTFKTKTQCLSVNPRLKFSQFSASFSGAFTGAKAAQYTIKRLNSEITDVVYISLFKSFLLNAG